MASGPGVLNVPRGRERRVVAAVSEIVLHMDYVLMLAVGALVGYGLWIVKTVTRDDIPGDENFFFTRQALAVGLGVAAMLVLMWVSPEALRRLRYVGYVLVVVLLGVVLVTEAVRGSRRWIDLGFYQLQPSELGKIVAIVMLAALLAERARTGIGWRAIGAALGVIGVPAVLVFIQPDFGTSLVYVAALVGALIFAGVPWKHLAWLGSIALVLGIAVLWILPANDIQVLKQYQVDRLVGFLDPSSDPSDTTYNVTQSITAVGAGGLHGRGEAGATQTNLNYLPEHQTDFIFSSLAEQRGFLGAAILLLLYAVVLWRGIKVIAIAPSLYQAILAGTIVVVFLFQIVVNVGMTIGIAPVVGITLPFVSYGGSSMLTMLALMGLLQAIHVRGRLRLER